MRSRDPGRARRAEDPHQVAELRREPASPSAEMVRSLQRSAGNAAVARLLSRPVLQRAPEIEPTEDAMGQRTVDELNKANAKRTAMTGIHYPHNYQRAAQTDPSAKALWKEDYWEGYANPQFFKRVGRMNWELLPMVDASAGIKAWLKGPTIAECFTTLVAIQLDTVRAAVGDDRFNAMFSWWPDQQPERGLLRINWEASRSNQSFLSTTDEAFATIFAPEEPGKRTVKKGEWYYFYNHPKYLLKHPGGAFQGENSICMDDTPGAQKYSGFGVGIKTEAEMLDEMAMAYNAPRTERDYETLVRDHAPGEVAKKGANETWRSVYDKLAWNDRIPSEYLDIFKDSSFPDLVDAKAILSAPEYTIHTVRRKGGFQSGGGKKLDPAMVAAARTAPKATVH